MKRGRGEPGCELHHADGQVHQVIQRRKAAAEVVDGHAHLAIGQALQNGHRRVGILVERALRRFKHQPRRISAAGRKGLHQMRDQIGMIELPRVRLTVDSQILLGQRSLQMRSCAQTASSVSRAKNDERPVSSATVEQIAEAIHRAIGAAQAERLTRIPPACRSRAGRWADTEKQTAACPAPCAVRAPAPAGW